MAKADNLDLLDDSIPLAKTIQDRYSKDLVIALVGPVGSGCTTAANQIAEILETTFGYSVCTPIKPSDIIKTEARRVGIHDIASPMSISEYVDAMQTAGNLLRKKFGNNYLAAKAIEQIYAFKQKNGGFAASGLPLPGRRAFIVDSIKNNEELALFRSIYQDAFVLVGVFAPDEMRKKRLIDNGANPKEVQKIIDRDQGEVATFGQKTRKIFVDADIYLCNDAKEEELTRKIKRFLDIVFDVTIHTPTRAESAMYEASAAASNSACMSRQVGASIVSSSGELISVGWNDVPKFGGGLYVEDDQSVWDNAGGSVKDRDHRCFKWDKKICHNEIRKSRILETILNNLKSANVLKRGTDVSKIRAALAGTEIDSLIEFSRAIHAEMEAILAVAREGRDSLVGATLYTTTYPCHNCARHIVASGIRSVIYIQPYSKSLAVDLHYDSVTEDPTETKRVVFRQYDGVAPRNYLRLFNPISDRKKRGHVKTSNAKTADPIFRIPLDSFAIYEAKVIADLTEKEQNQVEEIETDGGGLGRD